MKKVKRDAAGSITCRPWNKARHSKRHPNAIGADTARGTTWQWPRTGARERGDATLEAVIGVPAFALFVLLIIFAGRVANAHQAVDSAAAEAARSASISRTQAAAATAGTDAAAHTLANEGLRCRSTSVAVDTSGFTVPAGTPARVTARVACAVDLGDLTAAGLPGTLTVSSSMDSPIDTFRERP